MRCATFVACAKHFGKIPCEGVMISEMRKHPRCCPSTNSRTCVHPSQADISETMPLDSLAFLPLHVLIDHLRPQDFWARVFSRCHAIDALSLCAGPLCYRPFPAHEIMTSLTKSSILGGNPLTARLSLQHMGCKNCQNSLPSSRRNVMCFLFATPRRTPCSYYPHFANSQPLSVCARVAGRATA